MSTFFAMGGYAVYVWPAFGVTFAGLAAAIIFTLVAYNRAAARLAALDRK
jgi:heme exporter protein CcmD